MLASYTFPSATCITVCPTEAGHRGFGVTYARMQTNKLKQKLHSGQRGTVIAPLGSSAGFVEVLGYMGFDGVFLDGEHGSADWEEMENMVRAADAAGYSSIVRVQHNDPAIITRALDRGASGVQIPH